MRGLRAIWNTYTMSSNLSTWKPDPLIFSTASFFGLNAPDGAKNLDAKPARPMLTFASDEDIMIDALANCHSRSVSERESSF